MLSRRKFVQTVGIGAGTALDRQHLGPRPRKRDLVAIEPDLQAVEGVAVVSIAQ